MLTTFAVVSIVLCCVVGFLVWRVVRDFFSALESEYESQMTRDPEYKRRRRMERKIRGQRVQRLVRLGAFVIKRPIYLLAVTLGVKR